MPNLFRQHPHLLLLGALVSAGIVIFYLRSKSSGANAANQVAPDASLGSLLDPGLSTNVLGSSVGTSDPFLPPTSPSIVMPSAPTNSISYPLVPGGTPATQVPSYGTPSPRAGSMPTVSAQESASASDAMWGGEQRAYASINSNYTDRAPTGPTIAKPVLGGSKVY